MDSVQSMLLEALQTALETHGEMDRLCWNGGMDMNLVSSDASG